MNKVARIFSYVLHPVFMPLLGLLIIFNSGIYETDIPFEYKKYTYLIVAFFSVLLPLSIMPLLLYFKVISNFELSKHRERSVPIAITALCLVMLYVYISKVIPLKILTAFGFSLAALSIVMLAINIFYKISMHLLAIGGLTGLVIASILEYNVQPFIWLAVLILLGGIAASSRLILKAHNIGQILSAYTVGLVVMLSILLVQI